MNMSNSLTARELLARYGNDCRTQRRHYFSNTEDAFIKIERAILAEFQQLVPDDLRKKVTDYVAAAYLHGLPTENLDTGELEPPRDIADTDWIVDSLLELYLTHRNAELEKLLEQKKKYHNPGIKEGVEGAFELIVPVSAIEDLIKKGE